MSIEDDLLAAWLKVSVNLRNHRFVNHMPYNQAFICHFIYLAEQEAGHITATQLCEYTGMLKSHINKILKDLEEKKLIKIQVNPKDRRERFIFFTDSGKEIYLQEKQNSTAIAAYAAKELGEKDTRQIIRLFDKVSDIFAKGDFKNER